MLADKRYYLRIPSDMPCVCEYEGKPLSGTITNFSPEGLRILFVMDKACELSVNSSMKVSYETSLELDTIMAPVKIQCEVNIRNVVEETNPDYAYSVSVGCYIKSTTDMWS